MSSSGILGSIEKLKGRDNYATWKIIVRAYLESESLWTSVAGTSTETDSTKKLQKDCIAKSRLILLVDPVNISHIQSATTAKEVWEKLEKAFDDNGLSRRVGLLRSLISTKLDECNSMEQYVDKIVTTAHKLKNAKFDISDEWVGTLLLAGLTEHYRPMIMAIESSSETITADFVKTKLLQDANALSEGEKAMFSKSKEKKVSASPAKCFECDRPGHFARDCNVRKKRLGKDKKQQQHQKKPNDSHNSYSCFAVSEIKSNDWIIDSGSSAHMVHDRNWISNAKQTTKGSVTVANGSGVDVECTGQVELDVKVGTDTMTIDVNNVLCVPSLCTNLISVSQLVKSGSTVNFDRNECTIRNRDGCIIGKASLCDNVYKLNLSKVNSFSVSSGEKQNLWHRRFGHIGDQYLSKVKNTVDGIEFGAVIPSKCAVCSKGKQTRLPFKPSNTSTSRVLELIHSDVCGPMPVDSFGGSWYYVLFLDDYSRKVFVKPIKHKSDVFAEFCEFKSLVENQTGNKIRTLRTDGGGEYCNNKFGQFLKQYGIEHQKTTPYTPEQNGMAERMNRSLVEKVRCMLFDAHMDIRHWGEAVAAAAYLINRSPCKGLQNRCPEEI